MLRRTSQTTDTIICILCSECCYNEKEIVSMGMLSFIEWCCLCCLKSYSYYTSLIINKFIWYSVYWGNMSFWFVRTADIKYSFRTGTWYSSNLWIMLSLRKNIFLDWCCSWMLWIFIIIVAKIFPFFLQFT